MSSAFQVSWGTVVIRKKWQPLRYWTNMEAKFRFKLLLPSNYILLQLMTKRFGDLDIWRFGSDQKLPRKRLRRVHLETESDSNDRLPHQLKCIVVQGGFKIENIF